MNSKASKKGQIIGFDTVQVNRADLCATQVPRGTSTRFTESASRQGVELPWSLPTACSPWARSSNWSPLGVGNPGAVIDYQTRFTKPVVVEDPEGSNPTDYEGTTISVEGKVGALDAEARTARIDLAVSANDSKVLLKCQAVVQL